MRGSVLKRAALKKLTNLQGNNRAGAFFNKKRFKAKVFYCEFAKFFRTVIEPLRTATSKVTSNFQKTKDHLLLSLNSSPLSTNNVIINVIIRTFQQPDCFITYTKSRYPAPSLTKRKFPHGSFYVKSRTPFNYQKQSSLAVL